MFKRLLLGLLICPSILCAGELQSRRFLKNNGGLIDHISPLLIPDNNASAIENITMDDRGKLSKRNGYTVIQSTKAFTTTYSTWVVTGGAYHTSTSGNPFFVVVVGTAVYRISNAYGSYTNAIGNSYAVTSSTSNYAQSAQLQDSVVFCNEVDKPFYVTSSTGPIAISTSTFSAAKTCATYGNYLVIGNTTESTVSFPSRVRWSDINNINSFPSLNYIDAEPDSGDPIVGIVPFDEAVYIFKRHSIFKMLITGQDGPNAFLIRPVARNIGAWSKMSIQPIPNVGIAFLAQNTAYLLNNDGLTPIGDPIQRTFDLVQRSMWSQAVGGVYPKKYQYWLAVSTTGTTNTEVLVYDYIQNNWTVYDGMKLSMMAQAETASGDNILITGGYNATTWQQDNGSVDTPTGSTTSIVGSYTTGDLFTDTIDIRKNFKYLYLYTIGDSTYTLTITPYYDLGNNSENMQSITIGSNASIYGTGVYDTDTYVSGATTITRLELNRMAKTIRLKFNSSDINTVFGLIGWTIVYSMEDYTQ